MLKCLFLGFLGKLSRTRVFSGILIVISFPLYILSHFKHPIVSFIEIIYYRYIISMFNDIRRCIDNELAYIKSNSIKNLSFICKTFAASISFIIRTVFSVIAFIILNSLNFVINNPKNL